MRYLFLIIFTLSTTIVIKPALAERPEIAVRLALTSYNMIAYDGKIYIHSPGIAPIAQPSMPNKSYPVTAESADAVCKMLELDLDASSSSALNKKYSDLLAHKPVRAEKFTLVSKSNESRALDLVICKLPKENNISIQPDYTYYKYGWGM